MTPFLARLRRSLQENSDPLTQASSKRFFKEVVKTYGVKTAQVGKIAKEYFQEIKTSSKKEIFALCDELWNSGYMEESFIACDWAYRLRQQFEPADFSRFETWVNTGVTNWASCDTLCNHTIGTFIEMYPEYLGELKSWAVSKNRWMRRAAAVTLIIPARQGKFLADILEIADILLLDADDLVQKGYGWMLKAASQAHEEEVLAYVLHHKATMPRTALRYAIEKMSAAHKLEAMKK